MTDTDSNAPMTSGEIASHGERHGSMSEPKSRRKTRVDQSKTSPQVTKSHASKIKSRAPLPREVTFSPLPLGGGERDPRGGGDQQNPPREGEPEHFAPIAERVLDDLAARRAEVLNRLRRVHRPTATKQSTD